MMKGVVRVAAAVAACVAAMAGVVAAMDGVVPPRPAYAGPAAEDLVGVVTAGDTGAPIAGAEVQLWGRPRSTPAPDGTTALAALNERILGPIPDLAWPAAPIRKATTGADGAFRIPAAPDDVRAWLVFVAKGRAVAMTLARSGDVRLDAAPAEGVQVVVYRDLTAKPVAGADVRVFPHGLDAPQAAKLTTGADGIARIGLSAGAFVYVSAPGMAPTVKAVGTSRSGPPVVALEPAAAVAGSVFDEAGAPIGDARVFFSDGRYSVAAVTAADGSFRFAGVRRFERLDNIVATAPGFTPVRVSATGGDPAIRIVMARLRTLTGTIRSVAGKPCPGCAVTVAMRGEQYKTTTAADGTFSITGIPADIGQVHADTSGSEEAAYRFIDLRPGAKQAPVDLRLQDRRRNSTLRLRILDEARKPVAGAGVRVQYVGADGTPLLKSLRSDASGDVDQALPVRPGVVVHLEISTGFRGADGVRTKAYTSASGGRPTEIQIASITTVVVEVRGDDGAVIPPSNWTGTWAPMPASTSDLRLPESREASEGVMRVPANMPFELLVMSKGRGAYAARRTAADVRDGVLPVQLAKESKVRVRVDGSAVPGGVAGIGGDVRRLDPDLPVPIVLPMVRDGDVLTGSGLGPGRWVACVRTSDRQVFSRQIEVRFEGLTPGTTKDLPAVKLPATAPTCLLRSGGVPLLGVRVKQPHPILGEAEQVSDESGRFIVAGFFSAGPSVVARREGFASIELPKSVILQGGEITMVPAASIAIRRIRQPAEHWRELTIRNGGREFVATEADASECVFLDDLTPGPVEIIESDGSFRRVTRGEAVLGKITEFDLPPR